MGFNIGRFIGGAFSGAREGSAGGILPAIIGGVIGGVSEGFAGNGGESGPVAAATVGRATQAGPLSVAGFGAGPQFSGGGRFALPSSIGPIFAAGRFPLGRGFPLPVPLPSGGGGNGKNPIQIILAKARAATGGPVTRNKIIDAAKACGLETAASTFGIDLREVCLVIVKGRTRRRRGVSAADIRRTKRTINFASKVRKDLKALAR